MIDSWGIETKIKVLELRNEFKKYPAGCKSVETKLAKNWKYMHVGFTIDVIQTGKNRKYMHI